VADALTARRASAVVVSAPGLGWSNMGQVAWIRTGTKRDGFPIRLPLVGAVEGVARRVDEDDLAHADFSHFYTEHLPRLMGSLTLYTGDRELAMDLAQETMARAYRDWRKVVRLDSPAGWLHRVAFNLANSAFRRKLVEWRATSRSRAEAQQAHHDPDAGDAVAVRRVVASLPSRQKTALVLRYYADLPVNAVADAMGCAEGTVRALTSQALASLRRSGLSIDRQEDDS
jgi:RNA polymerase sigma-70 factor (ECF subfamily)